MMESEDYGGGGVRFLKARLPTRGAWLVRGKGEGMGMNLLDDYLPSINQGDWEIRAIREKNMSKVLKAYKSVALYSHVSKALPYGGKCLEDIKTMTIKLCKNLNPFN